MTTVKTDDYVRLPNASNTTLTRTQPTIGAYALMMSKRPKVNDVYQTAIERSKNAEYETFDAREVLGLHDQGVYRVTFRSEVVMAREQDLLTREQQRAMIDALEIAPEKQKPLTKELRGYYRWRTGSLRVVYGIDRTKKEVIIIAIGQRRDNKIYITAQQRAY